MRIISGIAKGRKLFSPSNNNIRPTADRAKEALFSILGNSIENATVLDFYAGTGALGLEALSRGAAKVIFIDKAKASLEIISKNLQLFGENISSENVSLIKYDLQHSLPIKLLKQLEMDKVDIIFADPPYSKGLGVKILHGIGKNNLLKENGILVVEERFTEELPEETEHFSLKEKRLYGEAAFWFYQLRSQN